VRHQRALWERSLELRILLQRPLAASNRLPQPAVRAAALAQDGALAEQYSQLLQASADTLGQLLELQAALLANNPGTGVSAQALQQAAEAQVGAAPRRRCHCRRWLGLHLPPLPPLLPLAAPHCDQA
jgi:hypothetical protein